MLSSWREISPAERARPAAEAAESPRNRRRVRRRFVCEDKGSSLSSSVEAVSIAMVGFTLLLDAEARAEDGKDSLIVPDSSVHYLQQTRGPLRRAAPVLCDSRLPAVNAVRIRVSIRVRRGHVKRRALQLRNALREPLRFLPGNWLDRDRRRQMEVQQRLGWQIKTRSVRASRRGQTRSAANRCSHCRSRPATQNAADQRPDCRAADSVARGVAGLVRPFIRPD